MTLKAYATDWGFHVTDGPDLSSPAFETIGQLAWFLKTEGYFSVASEAERWLRGELPAVTYSRAAA
jgi:hypothetical protein